MIVACLALIATACAQPDDEAVAGPGDPAAHGLVAVDVSQDSMDAADEAAVLPSLTDTDDRVGEERPTDLPIAPLLNPAGDSREVHDRIQVLLQECMASKGFEYNPAPFVRQVALSVDRRYGITDVAVAETDGYLGGTTGTLPHHVVGHEQLSPGEQEAWHSAFFGDGVRIVELPDDAAVGVSVGGCLEVAESAIYGDRLKRVEMFYLLEDLANAAYSEARMDTRTEAAYDAWSTCMADKGYSFTAQDEAHDAAAPNPRGPGAIAIAADDAACNLESGLAETWFAVEVEIQQALIEENRDLVEAWLAQLEREAQAADG